MKEIQVVIMLTGYGYNLFPFTEKQFKHLLPISNKPLLAYILEKLNSHYFSNLIFVCNKENRNEIEHYVRNKFSFNKKLNNNLTFYSTDKFLLPSEALVKLFCDNILYKDFLLVNGDVITDCNFNEFVDFHYLEENDLSVCFVKDQESNLFLLTDCEKSRVFKMIEKEDMKNKGLRVKDVFLKNHLNFDFVVKYSLASVYFCDVKIIRLLARLCNKFAHFGEEILPFLLENQYNKKLITEFYEDIKKEKLNNFLESVNDDKSDSTTSESGKNNEKNSSLKIRGFFFKGLNKKVDSLQDYKKINIDSIAFSKMMANFRFTENNEKSKTLTDDEKKKKGKKKSKINYIISESCQISENVIINKSVIANNTKIGKNSNINNSVILKETIIGENCIIDNCILGNKVVINNNMKLYDCSIGDECVVIETKEGVMEGEMMSEVENLEVIRKNSNHVTG